MIKIKKLLLLSSCCLLMFAIIHLIKTLVPIITDWNQHNQLSNETQTFQKYILKNTEKKNSKIPKQHSANQTTFIHCLTKKNPDTTGWIVISGTSVQEIIVRHTNNQYYLSHGFYKNKSRYGCIFLDFRNNKNFSSKNNILYGHNMRDGSMFHELVYFKKQHFFQKNKSITIYTGTNTLHYKIFSVYVLYAKKENIPLIFSSNKSFLSYKKKCQQRSLYKSKIKLTSTDELLTLVTCSYEGQDTRTIVQAQKIR